MKILKTIKLALVALAALAAPLLLSPAALAESHSMSAEQDAILAGGTWTNQGGSTATFEFQASSQPGTYTVSGTYVNREAGYLCQGTPYPLTGIYYSGTLTISFSVAWSNAAENCQSVTGWTGYFGNNLDLVTQWNMAFDKGTSSAISSGKDVFTYK